MSLLSDQPKANKSSKPINPDGEHKIISVLFTDVVSYTALTEKLNVEIVQEIMNNHFKLLIESVNRYGGTVDQLLGDGMVAFFGAPKAYEDHAQRACYAALAMQEAMRNYAKTIRREYGMDFSIRIGVNAGPVLVGTIGNEQHAEYVAIGDTVNLASRMETASRPGGILVTENVHALANDFFRFETIGEIGIRGKEKPVVAYRLLEALKTESRFEAAVARGLTRFVGREKEIEALKGAYDKLKKGSGGIMGITGEPGIGKSRLLKEFREGLKPEEMVYLEGNCLHYGSQMPYRPLIDILKRYFCILEESPEGLIKERMRRKLEQLDESLTSYLPFLYEMLSLKVEDERYTRMENQYKRNRLFEAISSILFKESAAKPVVIAIEDLHWIDRASEDYLNYLIPKLTDKRILLILLYRPEFSSPWKDRFNYQEVHLGQLSTTASNELIQVLLSDGVFDSRVGESVLMKTGGNPLFVEEFIHTLIDSGSIRKEGNRYNLDNTLDTTIKLPDTVQGIIAARIDHLPEGLKNTLQVAAVIGRDFSYTVLQDVMQQKELKDQLMTLRQLEFIISRDDAVETEFLFKHALIQEVVYNSLLQKRRKEFHENIARSIERLYADRIDELVDVLAYHYQESNSTDKAVEYLSQAGKKALAQFAIEEAYKFYEQAFKAISSKTGKTPQDQSVLLDIILSWAEVFYYRGYFRDLIKLLNSHKSLAEELGDKSRQAMLLGWLGNALYISGQNKESYQHLHQALELAETSQDQKAIAYICAWLVWTCNIAGLAEEGLIYGERAVQASSKIAEAYPYFKSRGGMGIFYIFSGKNTKALELSRELLEYGHTRGNIRSLALAYWISGMCQVNSGDPVEAIEIFREGLNLDVDPVYRELLRYSIAYTCILSGRFQEAETALQTVLRHVQESGGEIVGWPASAFLGMVLISQGQMKKGFYLIEEFNRNSRKEYLKQLFILSEYFQGILYAYLAAPPERIKATVLIKNLGVILKYAPFAARKAIAHYTQCAGICSKCGFNVFAAMAYLELGRLYKRLGKRGLARENLSAAAGIFRECEAGASLKQAEELLKLVEKGNVEIRH